MAKTHPQPTGKHPVKQCQGKTDTKVPKANIKKAKACLQAKESNGHKMIGRTRRHHSRKVRNFH